MEHKGFKLEIKEINDEGEFKGLLSTYGFIDSGGDRVNKGAFKNCLGPTGQKKIKLLWQHDTKSPIGSATISDSPQGLAIDGKLNLLTTPQGFPKVPKAHEAHALLINKDIDELSMGYVTNDYKYNNVDGQSVRDLLDVNVMESSIVTFAMNSQCKISEAKNLNGGDNLADNDKSKIEINNSKESASSTRKWGDLDETPIKQAIQGASNSEELAKEACLTLDDGWETNMSKMNYLHHTIKDNVLIVDNIGVQAARERAAQQGIISGDVEKHLKKHYKDLGLKWDKNGSKGEEGNQGGKSASENIEHKEANPVEGKALGFADLLKIQNANDMRWKLQDALNSSFRQLMNDDAMTIDDKVKQLETNVDDFATAYKEAMKLVLQASANNKTAKKQVDEVLEIKQLEIETKAGKKISKANKDKIQRCKDGVTDLMSVLEDLLDNDVPEDGSDDPDNDTGDEEDGKGCKPKSTSKSQNSTNKQEKVNNDTLELKSEELQALEALCKTINEK